MVSFYMDRISRRTHKGAVNWIQKHDAYIVLWNNRQASRMYYLAGPVHRPGPYIEYLRWLQQNSRLSIKPPFSEEHIANLPDSDDDNEIIDEYDNMTREGTQPQRAPFQNYMV